MNERQKIGYLMSRGAKYLVLNDHRLTNEEYLKPFLINKMGHFSNIEIYDLRSIKMQLQ